MIPLDIVIFLIVLGVLIFIHELGHFLAAKACGIYCDRFSLGMPPRLWGFRWGETDCCIGALPIGGYVKMAGQEDVPRSDKESETRYKDVPRERWFDNKPVWQRFIVVVAGPMMNLGLGVVLYGIVAAIGAEVPETKVDNRIGLVLPGSPAARAPLYLVAEDHGKTDYRHPDAIGWQTGDRILSINDRPITSITDVAVEAVLGTGRTLQVEIERSTRDGKARRYMSAVTPEILGDEEHPRFGVEPFATALVADVMPGMPAQEHGIQPGDVIVRANGELVDAQTFTQMVESMTEGEELTLEVERDGELTSITLRPKRIGRFVGLQTRPPLYGADPKKLDKVGVEVVYTSPELREKTGLKPKDIILEVDGEPATVALLQDIEEGRVDEMVELKIHQRAILYGLLQQEKSRRVLLEVTPVGAVGIVWGAKMVYYRVPPSQVIPEAFRQGYQALSRTVQTIAMLIRGSISPRDLGGPVMIFEATTRAARLGYSWLLEITAFISVNLCVVNLVPLPVLDGGRLAFLAVEGLRRKPLDSRVLERVQQVGLAVIIGLILFVTYNDIFRLVKNMIP